MRTNVKVKKISPRAVTHEGGAAVAAGAADQLRRSILSCFLWENTFYEDGESVTDRIKSLVPKVSARDLSSLLSEARNSMKLRHAPLFLAREMARNQKLTADQLSGVVQRPDEITEFLSIYWKDGKCPLAHSVKRGLAHAFTKFDEYQLAKYNRDTAIKLRDALFLVHAKPSDKKQAALWKRLVDGKLATPDTWEVELSASGNNAETWVRLINEKKLGALALIRNLRNMRQAGVKPAIITKAISSLDPTRVLPFRFLTAAIHNPDFETELMDAMKKCIAGIPKMKGKTVLLIDVSGSMDDKLSATSEVSRIDAAAALAILGKELSEHCVIYTYSDRCKKIASRSGMGLRDLIYNSMPRGGTNTSSAVSHVALNEEDVDRILLITDEQSSSRSLPSAVCSRNYIMNVATNQFGIGYGKWTTINGFSEAVFNYIREVEKPVEVSANIASRKTSSKVSLRKSVAKKSSVKKTSVRKRAVAR